MGIRWLVATATLTFAGSTVQAQEEAIPPPLFFERIPADYSPSGPPNPFQPVVDAARTQGGAGWIPTVKTWSPGSRLRVCFINGNQALNRDVAAAASAWNNVGANIRLDFGSPNNPRVCSPGIAASIRVAYNPGSDNWSRYGRDSILGGAVWNDASMHLGLETMRSPHGRGTVIHEFGHALGMFHEHQRPVANGCESEFNWPLVYRAFRQWNGWDRDMVDSQVRPVVQFGDDIVISENIDRASVMLYQFPAQLLVNGTSSHCYIPTQNNEISDLDARVLQAAYAPAASQARQAELNRSIGEARAQGRTDVAMGLALYGLPQQALDRVAAAYDREQAMGFNPGEGRSAREILERELSSALQRVR